MLSVNAQQDLFENINSARIVKNRRGLVLIKFLKYLPIMKHIHQMLSCFVYIQKLSIYCKVKSFVIYTNFTFIYFSKKFSLHHSAYKLDGRKKYRKIFIVCFIQYRYE